MDFEVFRKGLLVGLAVAAPVGPIGVLVIQRSLVDTRLGLSTGLGAAVADAAYALAGAVATTLVARIVSAAWLLELVGGAALAWFALRTFRDAAPSVEHRHPERERTALPSASLGGETLRAAALRLLRGFVGSLLLTLANPATILSFAALAASLGLARSAHAMPFALGVFTGSAAWWLFLSSVVHVASRRVTPRILAVVRASSGVALVLFAVFALSAALRHCTAF